MSGGKISRTVESSIFFDSIILLPMCTNNEKEVTELLFCRQIIRILIASIIEIMISKIKSRFGVLIKSQ